MQSHEVLRLGEVQLRVYFGDPGVGVSEHDPGSIQVGSLADFRGSGVPQLIRLPGLDFGSFACTCNGPPVAGGAVLFPRLPFGVLLLVGSRPVAMSQGGAAFLMLAPPEGID